METIEDLCNGLGITVQQLDKETEPEMQVCRHSEVCTHALCEHHWPHYPSSEIGTCGEEICIREGVVAACINVSDA